MLGAEEAGTLLPSFSRISGEFGAHYVTALCTPESETERPEQIAAPSQNELERMALAAPPMMGAEYRTTAVSGGDSPERKKNRT